ncbi:hypothetical protein VTN96DRAFT_5537 [Rasamsonia emersonii]|uniref:MFS transporter, SP family, sugar:H+ symporter n=1 Tax=Rasamsonia emersonii (strain ATCC 16479 / CBS 393.64 / IMI 116815) TaxID=1408163 RepID=A0A0F4YPZ6_RASE3|nr:MFS transporter, SP family, sugar:H+ symporter [Rasamsonia emersonii CBS 393.64]KKA20324.1 MFS transporter, SP family, sugar:H+ symporter [Rasamsonia emersonii CBS 393.64]
MADEKPFSEHDEQAKTEEPLQLDVPRVTWYKHPGLRKLYLMMPILFLGATVNGYDRSLLNGLQTLQPWQEYNNHPTGSRLGLFNAIYNIGGLCALPFSSYAADIRGGPSLPAGTLCREGFSAWGISTILA